MEGGTSYLVITRPGGHYRDALRSYSIEVDGNDVCAIGSGQTVTVDVAAGDREVRATIDWTGSPTVTITARPDEQVHLVVEPAGSAFTGIFQIFRPTSYLKLSIRE